MASLENLVPALEIENQGLRQVALDSCSIQFQVALACKSAKWLRDALQHDRKTRTALTSSQPLALAALMARRDLIAPRSTTVASNTSLSTAAGRFGRQAH